MRSCTYNKEYYRGWSFEIKDLDDESGLITLIA